MLIFIVKAHTSFGFQGLFIIFVIFIFIDIHPLRCTIVQLYVALSSKKTTKGAQKSSFVEVIFNEILATYIWPQLILFPDLNSFAVAFLGNRRAFWLGC